MYLAFDLDATLGDFMGVWHIMCALRQPSFYKNAENVSKYPSVDFEKKIDKAYEVFVRLIASAESGFRKVGLFRPGIFDIFKEVVALKKKGDCVGVIIYSNNGCKAILEFVRDVVHYVYDYKVFDDIVHFHHSLRLKSETATDVRKNWVELKRLLVEGKCKAPDTVQASDVMFFDDQVHYDLVTNLGKKYIKVSSYESSPDMRAIVEMYRNSLKRANLYEDPAFLPYAGKCFRNVPVDLTEYFKLLMLNTKPSNFDRDLDPSIRTMTRALKTLHKKKERRRLPKTKKSRY